MDPTDPVTASDPALRVFAYAVAEKAWLYVPAADVLMAAKERFTLQLRPAEVARELPEVGEQEVAEALEALEALERWGNVQRFYDTAAPETLDQFYAKRFLYQLTEAGCSAMPTVSTTPARPGGWRRPPWPTWPAEPWRFRVADHRAALQRVIAGGTRPRPLRGPVPTACWDSELGPAVQAGGVEIEEELVLDLLLDDLRSFPSVPPDG